MFFDNWFGIVRVVVVGILIYASLVATLRISGKRTLSKMNAFDLVVTVSLGSILATVLLSKDVAFFEGFVGLVLLASLQFIVAWLSKRSKRFEKAAKSDPRLLFSDGQIDERALADERMTDGELMAAIRGAGYGDPSFIAAIVLETDGSLSVIPATQAGKRTSFP